jgi:hypothetical protein
LPDCQIGILRGHTGQRDIVDAVARHISESLANISVPGLADDPDFDFAALNGRAKRARPGQVIPGW